MNKLFLVILVGACGYTVFSSIRDHLEWMKEFKRIDAKSKRR